MCLPDDDDATTFLAALRADENDDAVYGWLAEQDEDGDGSELHPNA